MSAPAIKCSPFLSFFQRYIVRDISGRVEKTDPRSADYPLTPAPRTTLRTTPRTTLKNQPNFFYGVQKYKKLTCSSYTIITPHSLPAGHLPERCFHNGRSELSQDGRKVQKSCLLPNVNVDGKHLRQITKINIQQRLPIVRCGNNVLAGGRPVKNGAK